METHGYKDRFKPLDEAKRVKITPHATKFIIHNPADSYIYVFDTGRNDLKDLAIKIESFEGSAEEHTYSIDGSVISIKCPHYVCNPKKVEVSWA